MRVSALVVVVSAALAGCAGPPPSAYVGGIAAQGGTGLGKNAAGENCTAQASAGGAAIFCGTWDQPAAEVEIGESGTGGTLQSAIDRSRWRSALDARFNCGTPQPSTILGDAPALLLNCTRKAGGWPQVALIADVGGHLYFADGILPSMPVMEREIGVLSGRVSPQAAPAMSPGQADSLLASRLAAQSFGAGDIGQYQALITAGTRANLAESYVPAERAYRAALALQQKALGRDNPNTAVPLMLVALQLSNQGSTAEADDAFDRAARLVSRASDPTALARLQHYEGLNKLNENKPAEALPLLQAAERDYAAQLPPEMLAVRPVLTNGPIAVGRHGGSTLQADAGSMLLEPDQQAALIGVVETRRYQAIALRELGRTEDATAAIRSATALAQSNGLSQRNLTARLYRTAALVGDVAEIGSGTGQLQLAARDFAFSQPGTRPLAQTYLLRGAQEMRAGDAAGAISVCRRGSALLQELKVGTSAALMAPCLQAYAAQAAAQPAEAQTLYSEMFTASQLVQGGITVQQIALASARLSEGAKDPRVGAAIRRQQDASLVLAEAQAKLDAAQSAGAGGAAGKADDLARAVAKAEADLADADGALQAAAPNYGQLVQDVASASDVLEALAPGEVFVSLTLGDRSGWVFVLRDGHISVAPSRGGLSTMTDLVKRVRATVEPTTASPPPFDIADAAEIYTDTIGQVPHALDGARSLVVVPVGPLLSLPFNVLLTGPASQDDLAGAPWLIRQVAIAHVPAAANFVSLRRASAAGHASQPWFGFGDFQPVTLAQAEKTFPAGACEDSAKLFAGLPRLPFAQRELEAARLLLGGAPGDELEGGRFNVPDVLKTDLRPFRVLHFATHALLPTDLRCQTEPAIVTSAPPGAPNANGALLTSSDVTSLNLDADVVVLSACNSGGPNGATGGESLSGLARAFFYAGARALMVTHWSVNDQATALLVAGTLQRLRAGTGIAESLRQSELSMLQDAGRRLPAAIAHPFYWGPFALVGEGRGRTVTAEFGAPGHS